MKKLILLVVAASLTGCNQFHAMFGAGASHVNYAAMPMIVAGQSNAANENFGDSFAIYTNVAFGGTSIEQWQKNYKWGQKAWETGPQLYSQIVKNTKGAHAVLLFWQGETEGLQCTDAGVWSTKFIQMVRDVRADVGYPIKVVYVQIGNTTLPHPCWAQVQEEQARAQGALAEMVMVSAKDLYPGPDGIHYSQESYKIMQQRMIDAMQGEGL